MTPKRFAVFFIIVLSQAYFISCDDKDNPIDGIVKQVADDIAEEVSSGMEYLRASVISITGDATVGVKEDLQRDAKLNKADKIIEGIKGGFEKVTIEHNARTKGIIEKITIDTAATGGVENPFVKELINTVTDLQENLLKLVLTVRDFWVDQINLLADDLKQHISGKVIAEKLQINLNAICEVKLKIDVATIREFFKKYHLALHHLENVVVSSDALDYLDEKMNGIIVKFLNQYIKGHVHVTNDVNVITAIVLHMHGHH